ncbi:anti-sigma factor domain-containing protein [Bacillus sp. SG-1]|uniref:anti-sigma factor domain-containing protein n=1 Tax=Bacillus sp. SG-1 TaxID=161544 RepID=UPI00015436DE|nr:anti-sigma factor domain-containing protein [Bacillus sp. SG-1]EDL65106.1 YkrI [Bacillus sp. SG-1]
MKKGIVMEVKPNTIIMMTPEGEFIKTRKQPSVQYEIGEELTLFPQMEETKTTIFQRLRENLHVKPVLSGAAVLLMLLFLLLPSLNEPEVYAYVSVDINPSFEMSINQDQEVMDLKPFNAEAEKILERMPEWEGNSIIEVTDEIIELSSKNGYMDDQKKVTVTTIFTEEAETKARKSIENELKQLTTEKLKEGTADIAVVETSIEVRDEAKAAGMTAGQLIQKNEKTEKKQAVEKDAKDDSSPSQNPVASKKEKRKEKSKEIPVTDKRPQHVKQKQAVKPDNSTANRNGHDNDTNEKKEKENNGKGNGQNPPAIEKKASMTEKDRGSGHSNGDKKQEKPPKERNGKDKKEKSQKPDNDKEKGNGN